VNSIGLYLAAAGSINPIIAAVLHNLSTLLVVFNSSRLIKYNPASKPCIACENRLALTAPVMEEEQACGA
jgi:cation-transporting P-type ATPase C